MLKSRLLKRQIPNMFYSNASWNVSFTDQNYRKGKGILNYGKRFDSDFDGNWEAEIYNRELKTRERNYASRFKNTELHKLYYDLPLLHIMKRIPGIKKHFNEIAFVGTNPLYFIHNFPNYLNIERLFICDECEESLKKSVELIQEYYDEEHKNQRNHDNIEALIPVLIDGERWPFQNECLDSIITNMELHWMNQITNVFNQYHNSLKSDGVLLGSMVGEDSLKQLRMSLSLAMLERKGGVSPIVSPMRTILELGAIIEKTNFKLPALDVTHFNYEFTSFFHILSFLQNVGESSVLFQKPKTLNRSILLAAAAIYESLYSKQRLNTEEENHILIDSFLDDYNWLIDSDNTKENELPEKMEDLIKKYEFTREENVIAQINVLFFIGWRHHEGQPQPKARGSAQFSLKDFAKEMEKLDQNTSYGRLIDEELK